MEDQGQSKVLSTDSTESSKASDAKRIITVDLGRPNKWEQPGGVVNLLAGLSTPTTAATAAKTAKATAAAKSPQEAKEEEEAQRRRARREELDRRKEIARKARQEERRSRRKGPSSLELDQDEELTTFDEYTSEPMLKGAPLTLSNRFEILEMPMEKDEEEEYDEDDDQTAKQSTKENDRTASRPLKVNRPSKRRVEEEETDWEECTPHSTAPVASSLIRRPLSRQERIRFHPYLNSLHSRITARHSTRSRGASLWRPVDGDLATAIKAKEEAKRRFDHGTLPGRRPDGMMKDHGLRTPIAPQRPEETKEEKECEDTSQVDGASTPKCSRALPVGVPGDNKEK